jgi:uncharacterized spore protein YtfJ
MEMKQTVEEIGEALKVKRVFGEPYEKDGITIIPAAKIQGGGGGGGGQGPDQGRGFGSGFGVNARPAGVYVVKGGTVSWQPAVDVNRIVLGAQVVAVVALLAIRSISKARMKTRRAEARQAAKSE